MTLNKGHLAVIESYQDYFVRHKIWWNLVQKQVRNQPGQGYDFLATFDLDLKNLGGQGHRTCHQTKCRS